MKMKRPLLAERLRMDASLKEILDLNKKIGNIPIHQWIRDLRKKLHMSQRQLAKRAALTQAQLSQIESGKAKITLGTLTKVMNALYCNPIILPVPREDLEDLIKRQTKLAAQKKLKSLIGSMALEKQLPNDQHIQKKIEEVADDLFRSGSTEIWDLG